MRDFPNVPNWFQWLAGVAAVVGLAVWLSSFLPNWLQLLAAAAAVFSIAAMAIRVVWQWFFSDMWARRSRSNATAKAGYLVIQYRMANSLREDGIRFQAISATVVADLILSFLFIAMGATFFAAAYPLLDVPFRLALSDMVFLPLELEIEINNVWAYILATLGVLCMINAFFRMTDAWINQETLVRPLTDWIVYHDRTIGRIRLLLAKAGMDDQQQATFINNVIEDLGDEPDLTEEENSNSV